MPTTAPHPLVRNVDTAQRRWFYGGGVHTWLATAADTGGAYLLFEDEMEEGKLTPLHTHPSDESFYILEGELLVHLDGEQHSVRAGGVSFAPRGVPHAFKVVSARARLLCLHTPATCEAFYLGASEPLGADGRSGPIDFERITQSGRDNGGFDLVGPPPF